MSEEEKGVPSEYTGASDNYDWRRDKTTFEGIREKTPEEVAKWGAVSKRCYGRYDAYIREGINVGDAQSMAVLNDEEVGPILANANLAEMEVCRKFDTFTVLTRAVAATKGNMDELRPKRENKFILKRILSEKILWGEKLTTEDYNESKYPGYQTYGGISSDIWHSLCQTYVGTHGLRGGELEKLPYIFSVPRENQKKIISSMLEDNVKEGLKLYESTSKNK